jgi:4-hydroxy-3-methylbut-2-enyl diphosphate reductase
MSSLLKKKVRLRITEVNKARRRVVGSIRSVLNEERKAASEALWETIQPATSTPAL